MNQTLVFLANSHQELKTKLIHGEEKYKVQNKIKVLCIYKDFFQKKKCIYKDEI